MKGKTYLFFLFIIIISIPVSAIGIIPPNVDLENTQERQQINLKAINRAPEEKTFEIYTEEELSNYTTCEDDEIILPANSIKKFKCYVELPSNIKAGKHAGNIGVSEKPPEDQKSQMAARARVESILKLFVPYIGKHLSIKAHAEDSVDTADIKATFKSIGTESIDSIKPVGFIKNGKRIVKKLEFPEFSLNVNKSKTIFKNPKLPPGTYTATIKADYDGKETTTQTDFRMGEIEFVVSEIKNVTGKTSSIVKIPFWVDSHWNKKTQVSAKLKIRRNGSIVGTADSRIATLDPWLKGKTMIAYWEALNMKEGYYDLTIELMYPGGSNSQTFKDIIHLKQGQGKMHSEFTIGTKHIVLIVLILVLTVLGGLWNKKRHIIKS
mgnify:FL=1